MAATTLLRSAVLGRSATLRRGEVLRRCVAASGAIGPVVRSILCAVVALSAASHALHAQVADASSTPAASQPATAPSVTLAAALARLGDADPTIRDTAQREVLDDATDGPSLVAALREARAHAKDLDTRLRLDTLLVQAQERVDLGPSRITMHLRDASLTEVLAELTKQSRATFTDPAGEFGGPQQMPKVTVDLDRVSYWAALKKLQEDSNLVFYPQNDGWRVMRGNVGMNGIRGEESGAFLIQPMAANYNRSVSYQQTGGGNEYFSFQFQLLAEPKIRLDSAQGVLQLDRAVDSNGNDLLGPQRTQQISVNGTGNTINCGLALKYPKVNGGEQIAEISGTLRVLMARRLQSMSSADLLAETSPLRMQTDSGSSLSIEVTNRPVPRPGGDNAADKDPVDGPAGVAAPNGGIPNNGVPSNGIMLSATVQASDPQANQRLQQSLQQMRVTDNKGRRLNLINFNHVSNDGVRSEIRITYMPNNPQESRGPYKLSLDVPTSFREIEIPFAMRDLKMP